MLRSAAWVPFPLLVPSHVQSFAAVCRSIERKLLIFLGVEFSCAVISIAGRFQCNTIHLHTEVNNLADA